MKYKCSKCELIQECDFGDLLTTQCDQCGSIISQFTDIHDVGIQNPVPAAMSRSTEINYLLMKKWAAIVGLVVAFLLASFFIIQYLGSQVGAAKNVVLAPTTQVSNQAQEDHDAKLLMGINLAAPKIVIGKDTVEITEVLSTDIPQTPYPIIKVSFCAEAICTKENSIKEIDFEDYPKHVPDFLSQDIITLKVSKADIPASAKGVGVNIYYKKKELTQ